MPTLVLAGLTNHWRHLSLLGHLLLRCKHALSKDILLLLLSRGSPESRVTRGPGDALLAHHQLGPRLLINHQPRLSCHHGRRLDGLSWWRSGLTSHHALLNLHHALLICLVGDYSLLSACLMLRHELTSHHARLRLRD